MGNPNEDRFRLLVAGEEVPIASSYTVLAGVFDVPSQFDMQVGHTTLLAELVEAYAGFTPFELYVNDVRVMQGEIDDHDGGTGDATELKVSGRDRLARLVDTDVAADRSFEEVTFSDLVEAALGDVGLGDVSVFSSNLANRKAITGKYKVNELVKPSEESTETELGDTVQKRTKTVHKSLVIEAGTSWWDFLTAQFQRGGLFLWSDVTGGFVLGQPNGKQPPSYRIVRRASGQSARGEVTVLGQPEFKKSFRGRHSHYYVEGRKGSGANGRDFARAVKVDDEMVRLLNPDPADQANGGKRRRNKFYRDDKVKTPEQAAFLALRKMAQARRSGFTLKYTISGHTLPSIGGVASLVVAPDTTVHVVDEILGIDEVMYVDDCRYTRGVAARGITQISVMRTDDLLFGDEDLLAPAPQRKAKSVTKSQPKPADAPKIDWEEKKRRAAEEFARRNFAPQQGPRDLIEGYR